MYVVTLARKPISEPTVAANVLTHGAGGLHIDDIRLATTDDLNGGMYRGGQPREIRPGGHEGWKGHWVVSGREYAQPAGRFPANFVLQHRPGCSSGCVPGCPRADLDGQSGAIGASRFFRQITVEGGSGGDGN